jgi:hypothetical protein
MYRLKNQNSQEFKFNKLKKKLMRMIFWSPTKVEIIPTGGEYRFGALRYLCIVNSMEWYLGTFQVQEHFPNSLNFVGPGSTTICAHHFSPFLCLFFSSRVF